MAQSYSADRWRKINEELAGNPAEYGLPERRDDSIVLASFNIRKLGKVTGKSKNAREFLARFCSCCDLIAVQEVQDDLSGVKYLKGLLGDEYGMAVSDITGGAIVGKAMTERLAFLFRWRTVQRTEVASDISYDRTATLDNLMPNINAFVKAFAQHKKDLKAHDKKVEAWEKKPKKGRGGKPKPPTLALPHFLTFTRTPYCVSFRIKGFDGAEPYEFLAVNAHLLYGTKQERKAEFEALIEWLVVRAKQKDHLYHQNFLLLGDLNLDQAQTAASRAKIDQYIKDLNKKHGVNQRGAAVNFPFLDTHPSQTDVFRTNARKDQTYDQIGLFIRDKRLPNHKDNEQAGRSPGEYDFGMFDFVELFARAVHGKSIKAGELTPSASFYKPFEHDVSDHMPIWIRLPMPHAG